MVQKTLTMAFENEFKKQFNVVIKDVKDGITATVVNEIMDFIIENDLFDSDGCSLVAKKGCEVVTKDTTELEVLF